MLRTLVIVLIMLAATVVHAIDLKTCVLEALKSNPEIKRALAEEKSAAGEKELVISQFFPEVYFNINYLRAGSDNISPYDLYSYSFEAQWEVFSGFSTYNQYKAARLLELAQRTDTRKVMMDVAIDVVRSYTEALSRKAEVEAAKSYVESARYTYKLAKGKYETGLVPYADVLHAKASLKEAEFELADKEREFEKALGDLAVAMGRTPGERFSLEKLEPVIVDFDEKLLVQEALDLSPEVRNKKLQVKAQEKKVASVKGEFAPRVILSSEWERTDESLWPDEEESNWNIQVRLRLPLFTGFSTWKRLKVEKAKKESLEFDLKRTVLEVRNAVWKAYQDYEKAKKRLLYAKSYLDSAKEDLRMMRKKYKVGLASIVDLTTTQSNLYKAESEYYRSVYSLIFSYYSLVRAVGKIPVVEEL
ncbi:outer membrane channel protein [Thermosulfidibacter takaii ABI70S6]|uniref:Outer membrane channel protein n=1 Tax=Thermosulfidibacter takaii (strain DSM 17441 / JCM 13301 / NBRC 103674 / ABI70S6) TaxID=1298851 RepID=A0A0S3QV01_THET7|nr:TolC family protein [Thermosulfidibacter takaii]BAT72169.1 outer membrane channel protein [Thermosulfidibacter takaii ABI70S6]